VKKTEQLLKRNKKWASSVKEKKPGFFSTLSEGQSPELLWIGCSDSRVPANQILDLPAGEIFVHRNIANVVVHTDLNCLSVIQFAVEALQVKKIVVCGHYGCGGVMAALEDKDHGFLDNWLCHIQNVQRLHSEKLNGLEPHKKTDLLCELNVAEQVKNVSRTTIVQNAWKKGADLTILGWIYNIKEGRLKDLQVSISSNEELNEQL